MANFTMNVSCTESLVYFQEKDYVEVKEENNMVYIKPVSWPVVGNKTMSVAQKPNSDCKVFGINSSLLKEEFYYVMVPTSNGWFQLVQIDFANIIYGQTAFISTYLQYDNSVKSKKVNVSVNAQHMIFGNATHVERVSGKRGATLLHMSKVNGNTNKITSKGSGLTYSVIDPTLQKGRYYLVERINNEIFYKKVSKKFIKENKNVPYISVSR